MKKAHFTVRELNERLTAMQNAIEKDLRYIVKKVWVVVELHAHNGNKKLQELTLPDGEFHFLLSVLGCVNVEQVHIHGHNGATLISAK